MPIIKLYANLRKLAGTNELSIKGTTISEVLSELVIKCPSLHGIMLDGASIRKHIIIMLNGHNVVDLKQKVKEQDIIAIFPPISGGQGEIYAWLV